MRKRQVKTNKPVHVWVSALHISKIQMYQFPSQYIEEKYNKKALANTIALSSHHDKRMQTFFKIVEKSLK